MLEKLFKLSERKTSVRTEVIGGSTTFLTMAYIIFVQPAVLSACGMETGAVFVATCLASAFTTILMGLLTNYPIAQAPAMGHNFFFAFAAIPVITLSLEEGSGAVPWQIALGAVFISGLLFLLLSLTPFMKEVVKAIPDTLKHAIAVGIGLLIAFLGLQWGGVVVDSPGTLVQLGQVSSPPVLLTIVGTLLIAVLSARQVRGAILIGIFFNTLIGLGMGIIKFNGVTSLPPSLEPTLFKLNILGAINVGFVTIVFTTALNSTGIGRLKTVSMVPSSPKFSNTGGVPPLPPLPPPGGVPAPGSGSSSSSSGSVIVTFMLSVVEFRSMLSIAFTSKKCES